MNFEPIRRAFQPLFGLERRETVSRLLYAILISVSIVDSVMILDRLWQTRGRLTSTLSVLIVLLLVQLLLLYMLRHGYTELAAIAEISICWAAVTYQAWSADGVRDVTISIYFLIILVAALLTSWHYYIIFSTLSLAAIWTFAILEAQGLRAAHIDPPLTMAGDLTAIFFLLTLLVYLVVNNVMRSLDAVRIGEEKFRKVFHVSPVAISITTLRGGYLLDANEAYLKLIGVDRKAAIGKNVIDLGFWSSDADRQRFVEKIKQQKSLHNPAYRFKSRSGEERITLASYELLEVDHESAILSMFHDVIDQRTAQQALQASEEKYRNFVEQSMEGIWFLGFDEPISIRLPAEEQVELIYQRGYIAECNDILAQMYGFASSADLIGMRLSKVESVQTFNTLDYPSMLQFVRQNYRSGNRESKEVTRQGETVYFLNNTVGVIKDNCLMGLWGTQLDITALKNAEEALRLSEARICALLNSIPDMIFEFSRDGTILQFIPSETNDPLIPPEQFLGKPIDEVLPAVADQTNFAIRRALQSGHVTAFQYELFQSGKNRTFEARITPLGTDTVLAMVRDITLQKWIEGEHEKLIAELEAKNAELERFTYTVSHDLKSPLITIRGFLGFVREDTKNGNLVRLDADIKRISDATEKMQRLLNDLLELSRVGRLVNEPKEVPFHKLIAEALELLHGRISQGNIAVSVAENLPPVFGDYQRLLEVMQNLIDNAAKFMGSQASPRIEIGQRDSREGMNIFYVRDNGMGIPPEFLDNIFGLFNKLDARSEGTGVGLALVKRIIEFHHGSIWVDSELGRGTTFFFTLPSPPNPGR
ncbi:MAG: ATP-binding protein [Byssovorax cruenta]